MPAVHFAQNNVAKDKSSFVESSYLISAKLTHLLTISILWQKMMTVAIYCMLHDKDLLKMVKTDDNVVKVILFTRICENDLKGFIIHAMSVAAEVMQSKHIYKYAWHCFHKFVSL